MGDKYDKPTAWAQPLDQGKAGTCTVYAVGNAACNHLMKNDINVKLELFIGGLLQKVPDTTGKLPTELDGCEIKHMQDFNTGSYGNISIRINRTSEVDNKFGHVLVYPTGGRGTHSVFMKKVSITQKGELCYDCVNSWGEKDPFPEVIAKLPENKLFEVQATWKPLPPQNTVPSPGGGIAQADSGWSGLITRVGSVLGFGGDNRVSEQVSTSSPAPGSAKSAPHKCEACNVTTTDADGLQAHLIGKNHAKVMKNLTQTATGKPTTQFSHNTPTIKAKNPVLDESFGINPFYCSSCNTTMSSEVDMKSHNEGKQHISKSKTPIKKSLTEEIDPFYCKVCDTTMNSEASYESHKNGKQHSKKVAAAANSNTPPKEVKRPYFCEICEVEMPGPAAWTDHLIGKPHAKKLKAKEYIRQLSTN